MFQHILYIVNRNGEIQRYILDNDRVIRRMRPVNKGADDTAILVDSVIVSREHGEFRVSGSGVVYRDLESSNGTLINGIHYGFAGEEKEKELEHGDVLKIDTNDTDELHEDAVLMVYIQEEMPFPWTRYMLEGQMGEIIVGRDAQNSHMVIHNNLVSRSHASFFRGTEGWAVSDRNSANGVYINNWKLQQNMYMQIFDCVRIVDTLFIFLGDSLLINLPAGQIRRPQGLAQTRGGRNLSIQIKKRTAKQGMKKITLLQDINLLIHAGEMVLVLGGSGAGKTTFMNAVMGYEKADGTICYGDVDVYSQYQQMKYEIGFVPQDTLLRESDSVYDTLFNAAQMKMPASATHEQQKNRVEHVLGLVNLSHVSGSLIKSISGGEKKRVSAGVELVADPGLFFLDEPDSGLDAQSAIELMENLRQIADSGKIVMVISHSPDRVSELFDKVIVLAKSSVDQSGHLAFFGSVPQAYEFFGTESLEGVVGRINARDGQGEQYIQKWRMYENGGN